MRELSLHLLDIAENSVAAGAQNILIAVEENTQADLMRLVVKDDGQGMNAETVKQVLDPFFTSRTTRKVGLGLPLLKEAAEACDGSLKLTSKPGEGTVVEVEFKRSHIDRMPLGDLGSTFLNLLIAYPHVHWQFLYQLDNYRFVLDDEEIKRELEGISLTEPAILSYLRGYIETGLAEVTSNSA